MDDITYVECNLDLKKMKNGIKKKKRKKKKEKERFFHSERSSD